MKTELRRLLEDEFQVIGEQMPAWEREINDFWLRPAEPDLAIWAVPYWLRDIPEPPDGTVSEREPALSKDERGPVLRFRNYRARV